MMVRVWIETWKRILALFARERLDREFDEEAGAHLDLATEDYIRRGYPPAEARRMARVRFGSQEAAKDAHRDSRGAAWLESFLYDVRHAVRGLMRDRMFAVASIIILALSVGLNVTTFRIVDATLLHGYPLVKQNSRMLFVDERYPYPGCCVTYSDFEAWRSQARSFEDLAFSVPRRITLSTGADDDKELFVLVVSANAFHLLGVAPALGRDFRLSDEKPGADRVVIVSHRYWITKLGGRADVIGHKLFIDKTPASIVGVMPERFNFPRHEDIWLPLEQTPDLHRNVANGGDVFGRLRDGVSESAARSELETINARLAIAFPATNRGVRPVVQNFMVSFSYPNGRVIYGSLWAAAWLVLGIACANLTNLALARAQGRAREICTRIALGAGRGRVARQWLVEGVLLALAAGFLAWWISVWTIQLWAALTNAPYQMRDYSAGVSTVAYLVAVVSGATIAVTLAPLRRLWRLDLNGALKSEARGASLSLHARRLSAVLVTGQMALAIILMSGAGVLGRSLWNVMSADIGVREPETILVGRFDLPQSRYASAESRSAFFDSLVARLAATPGVVSATVASGLPADDREPLPVEFEGQVGSIHGAPVVPAGPDYFRTLGAPILAGREFNRGDRLASAPLAIVNRRFAETYFPGRSAIGQRIRIYPKRNPVPGQWRTIVGVASNVMQNDVFRQHSLPAVYVPLGQEPASYAWFLVRVPNVSDGLAFAVRAEAARVDTHLEITDFASLKTSLGFQMGQTYLEYMGLFTHAAVAPVFAGIALLLAGIGLYAVVSRAATQRTKEIGVRMALGATSHVVQRFMLWEAMGPVMAGLMLGLVASLGVNRILQSQLVGVSPYDALTLIFSPIILILIAVIGSARPVLRASRVDPAVALRHD